jgi:hypothetical protein
MVEDRTGCHLVNTIPERCVSARSGPGQCGKNRSTYHVNGGGQGGPAPISAGCGKCKSGGNMAKALNPLTSCAC